MRQGKHNLHCLTVCVTRKKNLQQHEPNHESKDSIMCEFPQLLLQKISMVKAHEMVYFFCLEMSIGKFGDRITAVLKCHSVELAWNRKTQLFSALNDT